MKRKHSPRVRTGYYSDGKKVQYEIYLLESGFPLSISWDKNGNKIAEITWLSLQKLQDFQLTICTNAMDFMNKFLGDITALEGEFLVWHENGQLAEKGEICNNLFEGYSHRWYKNGNKAFEVFYVNGVEHGIAKGYYENGILEYETEMQNGEKTGIVNTYFQNGNKCSSGTSFEERRVKKFTSWYENGQIKEESNWMLGTLEGDFRTWNENGDLIEETIYVDGKENWKKKKVGKVYLMKNGRNGYIKIGFTKNEPKFREKTFQSEEPEVELINYWYGSMLDEEKLHEKFAEKRLRGEWFNLNKDDINQIEEYFNDY